MTQASWAKRRPEQTMYCEQERFAWDCKGPDVDRSKTFVRVPPCGGSVSFLLTAVACELAEAWRVMCWRAPSRRDFLDILPTIAADTAAISRESASDSITRDRNCSNCTGVFKARSGLIVDKL